MDKAEEIPTHTIDGLLLSKWGRISTYANKELRNISHKLIFAQLTDEKELIKWLTTIIDNINKLPDQEESNG